MVNTDNELFDIVDENNILIGVTKSRDDVHKDLQDWHRTTGIWIINDKGQFLCQQRSFEKDVNPGLWQSTFGGHVKAGDSYDETAISELFEEAGLRAVKENLIPAFITKNEQHKHFQQQYIYKWNGDISELKFHDGEVMQVKWLSPEEFESIKRVLDDPNFKFNQAILEFIRR